MSKLSFRARALDASKPMPIYLAEELPDLPDYSAINRAVPQMPSGMEKEEECEHHLQRAICTGLIIPTPEVCDVQDLEFYERCYPPDYKMPKQHIHMQPLWQEQEAPEYDIDSEDERWLKQQRHPELTELMFEQMMDKLEKSSGQTVVTLHEAKLLLERHDDLVIAVYDYWLNKRLKTQHPLILSVKTESRPGQATNNPYLAFRRRTEKMQTRKNRKNDESSYEKMLKLRRDLARALALLELVARRERHKRELLRLTADIAERRYRAGDFAEPVAPRPQYAAVSLATPSFRRDAYPVQHYPPRAPPTPVDQPRQREKRPYKRRKHRHHPGSALALREPAYNSSSEDEARADAASPPDDGPFAFRRKPGCYYELPTATLCGDPVDPDVKDGLFEHEIDPRHRFTLTSLSEPYRRCVGFGRLRRARGGRLALDRVATPLDALWRALPPPRSRADTHEEVDLETKVHRTPKEITRDYHASGKHPWRRAFRNHLAANPELWIKPDPDAVKPDRDLKPDVCAKPEQDSSVKSDISVRTIDCAVMENLNSVTGKRSWSESSEESDSSLHPVEREFERFIDEVNSKWLHFRPRTPPPSPPPPPPPSPPPAARLPVGAHTALAVELRAAAQDPFTAEFSLGALRGLPESDDGAEPPAESGARGCSRVRVAAPAERVYVDRVPPEAPRPPSPPKKPEAPREPPAPVELPQIKIEKKKKEDTIEEVQLAAGVQLKTVHSAHSPLKKHIITSGAPRRAPDAPQLVTVAVSDTLKVRLQNHLLASQAGAAGGAAVVGLVQNGPFAAVASQPAASPGRLVQLAPAPRPPLLLGAAPASKLKVLHAHPLTHAQRAQLLHSRPLAGVTQLPAVVSLAALEGKSGGSALLKAAPGVTQLFEIKGAALGKGPHLVNVVRGARADDAPRRQLVATIDPHAKGGATAPRGQRVALSLDGRQLVRAAAPAAPHLLRHQIQLKQRRAAAPTISIPAPTKAASIPSSVVANLLQKNVSYPPPRLALPPAAFGSQLKARQHAAHRTELAEGAAPAAGGADDDAAVRRRAPDTLPMQVT